MTSDVQVLVRRGPDIAEWFDTVAHLRAKVFRSFPYLYEGDIEYEKHYLSMYARSADSLLVLVLADDVPDHHDSDLGHVGIGGLDVDYRTGNVV